jgi:hypothetical protein
MRFAGKDLPLDTGDPNSACIGKCCKATSESSGIIPLPVALGNRVIELSTHDLAGACRIFMDLAYPDGPHTIPAFKLPYFEMTAERSLVEFLPPAPLSVNVTKTLSRNAGGSFGYEFRLGSAGYPHLKLRVQSMDLHDREVWVFSVDTHDGFCQVTQNLSPEEAQKWKALVEQNRALKHAIEKALANAGYMTPIALLRIDLTSVS